jgi:hypothetical protein
MGLEHPHSIGREPLQPRRRRRQPAVYSFERAATILGVLLGLEGCSQQKALTMNSYLLVIPFIQVEKYKASGS